MTNIKSVILLRFHAPITKFVLSLCVALGIASAAKAENYAWTGGGTDTNYSTPANWGSESAYPGTDDGAMFIGGAASKTVTFDGTYSLDWVWVATGDVLTPVTWEAATSADGMTVAGNIGVADAGNQTGSLKAVSGTYTAGGLFKAGYGTGSSAKVEFLGGNYTFNGATVESFWNGDGNPNAEFTFGAEVGTGIGFAADIEIQNATVAFPNGAIGLGFWGTWQGDYDSAEANPDALAVGHVTVDINNGGVLSCGSIESPRELFLGGFGVEPITVNVNQGGTLKVGSIVRHFAGGASSVNLDGGTLEVLGTDTANFFPANGVAFTVGSNGATLNTNGKEITIDAAVTGTGTLNIVGGGKVTFTAEPTCTVSSSDDTPFVRPSDTPVVENAYYWVGGAVGEGSRRAFSATAGMWSLTDGGEAIADFVPGEGDTAVFTSGEVALYADNLKANIRAYVNCTFYTYNSTDKRTISGDIYIDAAATVTLKAIRDTVTFTGKLTGSGSLKAHATAMNTNVNIEGDTSEFTGTVNFVSTGHDYAVCRINDALSATNTLSSWYVYTTDGSSVPTRSDKPTGYTAFPFSNQQYYFGSLNAAVSNKGAYFTGSSFIIGGRDTDNSSFTGAFQGADNTIVWNADSAVNPDVMYTHGVINCAGLTVTGGGIVKFTAANALPAAFTLSGKGAYLGMTTDSDFNAAVAAVVTTVDADAPVGFYSSESEETSVDLSSATALVGQTLYKRGSGTVFFTKLPASGVNDLVVSEGTLVLPHGAVVGDVAVAQGAALVLDLIGAEDNEVVFKYDSISGEATYRNKASIGEVEVDDTENTWTYKVTGAARTFTWNGEDGALWNVAANWLADGEATTDIPSAIDTVLFDEDATISASGTLAGNVRIATDVTLTIPVGLTFAKLTAESGAAIAFSFDPIATVGGTLALITVGEASGVADALDLPSTYGVSVDSITGAITATRNAGTYTWTGAADEGDKYWGTWGNWSVNNVSVREVPAAGDTVLFPQLGEDDPEKWTVVLGGEQTVSTVMFLGATKLVGNYLACATISGTGKIILGDDAGIKFSGSGDLVNEIEVAGSEGHTCKLFADGDRFGVAGPLSGDGHLELVARDDQNGVVLKGDNKMTGGSITVRNALNYPNRNCSGIEKAASSAKVAWQITNGTASNNSTQFSWFRDNGGGEYYFGALGAGYMAQPGNFKNATLVIGGLGQTDTLSGCLACYATKSGVVTTDRRWDTEYNSVTVKKVGDGTLKVNAQSIHNYEIASGILELLDDNAHAKPETGYISFTGDGMLKLNDAFTIDVSTYIANGESTGPVAVDVGTVPREWAAKIPSACSGGLIKDGSGTLTLSAAPEYKGVTWVKDGTLVVPAAVPEVELTLDPRTAAGAVENAHVAGWAYIANTVVYANDSDDDNMTVDIDASGIAKIDISDPSFVDVLRNQKRVVICSTTGTITGFNPKKFVLGENLLVPEKPEGVADSKWDWTVKVMQVNGKNCICVTASTQPLFIRLR